MRFIDLFAGLGGFHTGFAENGFKCVFASEIDPNLQQLYEENYGIRPHGDITKVKSGDIPNHDVLCAGFPCQPFSLAGKKKGAKCPASGKLIDEVIRIAAHHKPKFVVLENVPNVITIEEGLFWEYLQNSFNSIGYDLHYKVISPIELGIPQNRKRVFIVCNRADISIESFEWPKNTAQEQTKLTALLDPTFEHKKIEAAKMQQLDMWQQLLSAIKLERMASVSLAAPEFGATYPVDYSNLTLSEMRKFKGAYGVGLEDCKTWSEILERLPHYARKKRQVAAWIEKSVLFSRNVYEQNNSYIDSWVTTLNTENNSWQILEWRGQHRLFDLNQHIVQFRASGIRVLKAEVAPSLIAMTPTQIPMIPAEARYMSHMEAAKLQHLHGLNQLPKDRTKAFKALGNAVNAKVVSKIADCLKEIMIASRPEMV